jgi:hypothetical protein
LRDLELKLREFAEIFSHSDAEGSLLKSFIDNFFVFMSDDVMEDGAFVGSVSGTQATIFGKSAHNPKSPEAAARIIGLLDDTIATSPSASSRHQPGQLHAPAEDDELSQDHHQANTSAEETSIVVKTTKHKLSSVAPAPSSLSDSVAAAWDSALLADTATMATTKMHMNSPQTYTRTELAAIKRVSELPVLFKFDGLMTPQNINSSVRAMGASQVFHNTYQGDVFGFSEVFVRAPCDDSVTFFFDNELDFHKLRDNVWVENRQMGDSGSMRKTIAKPNDHSRIIYRKKHAPPGAFFAGREFLNLTIWKRVSPTKMLVVNTPTEREDVPPTDEFVRAWNSSFSEFTEISSGRTHIRTYYHTNFNGNVPTKFTHYAVPRYMIDGLKECAVYFQHLVPLAEMEWLEGRDMGDLVMDKVLTAQSKVGWKHKVHVANQEVDKFFARSAALRQMQVLHPTFKSMIKAVVEQRVAAPGTVKKKLADLTNIEAERIGSFLKGEIAIGVNSDAAVDLWIVAQPALGELDRKYVWFRPFAYAVGLRIIKASDLGMKARVVFGSGLSMFDMASDVYMIILFFKEGKKGFAIATLIMILVNMFFQLALVVHNTSSMKTSTRIREVMYVLLCIKPGVDAFRISIDWESEEKAKYEPMHEMLMSKGTETVTESLPASVLQMFALLKATTKSKAAIASIVISIMTTAFTATIMTFDYDLAPKKRSATPEIYGFIRTDARSFTLFLMFTSTVFHVTNKVFACSMVAVVNPSLLFKLLAIDVALMAVFKVLRGDFIYASLPVSPVGAFLSLVQRTVDKQLVDFTGFMQGRHPYEIGGLYWAWSMISMLLTALAAAWYYNMMMKGESVGLNENTVWKMVGGISLMWLISFISLMRTIDPDYLHTFWQPMTAKQFTIMVFRNADTDEKKAIIFKRQFHVWRSIEGEVRTWVHANFVRWETEKPVWWTKKVIQKIPEEVLSKDEMSKLISGGKKERRRSSLLEDIGMIGMSDHESLCSVVYVRCACVRACACCKYNN